MGSTFQYDILETPLGEALIIIPAMGSFCEEGEIALDGSALVVWRDDGSRLRLENLHPRLRDEFNSTAFAVVEIDEAGNPFAYPLGDTPAVPTEPYADYLGPAFLWYAGHRQPLAGRPAARFIAGAYQRRIVVAPGSIAGAWPVGLALALSAPHRLDEDICYQQVEDKILVEHGFAEGTETGPPAPSGGYDYGFIRDIKLAHKERSRIRLMRPLDPVAQTGYYDPPL